ncbi:DNA internalization-related competence protein ComEC/Rec2 [Laribacter hongkongensis]|uniref:DNA internalization-related competence protein ComEC/Rec2 n=1 Tax=Laribacter hongkongensis TaxID=168471 RepID=UPI001EFEC0D1|nr:DNA internalization-related competence protein ComEC/Rec2 [Laribacter hongkongensis]MCG9081019.1 DNA internalization-related competence protein ComEC/Rec2 [Laribacter hongkongensis]
MPVLAWLVAGLMLPPNLPVSLPVHGVAAGVILLGCWAGVRGRWPAWGWLCLGVLWSVWRLDLRLAEQLPPAQEMQPVTAQFTVRGLPQVDGMGRVQAVAAVEAVPEGFSLPSRIQVRLPVEPSADLAGSRWQAELRCQRLHALANPYAFDMEGWLMAQGWLARCQARSPERLSTPWQDVSARIDRWRAHQAGRIRTVAGTEAGAGLLAALTIGDTRAITPEQWQWLARTGTTHVVSISGLHLALLAGTLTGLAGWLVRCHTWRGRSLRPLAAWAGLAGAAGYALLAGSSVPTLRALYMLAAGCWALQQRRRWPMRQVWLLALLAVLLPDPWAATQAGFWLSFGLVAALLAVGSGRPGAWRGMAAVAGTQLAIAAASVPLLLAWFGSLPLLSPLANLYAAPVLGGALTLASLLALLQPFDAPLQLVAWLLGLALEPLRWLAAGPQWQIPAPAGWAVVLALLGSVLMVLPSWSLRGLAACLWLPLLWPVTERPAAGEVWLTVLDIGQGLSVVVETASHTLVYDVGPGGPSGATASRTLLPYLAGRGVRTPDRVMLSHDDSDHAGGWAVLAPLWPDAGRWSSRPGRWPGQGFAACRQGQRWTWDGVEFRVLWPTAGVAESASDNNTSCVLKVTSRQGRSMLLTGDLEQAGEAELLGEPALSSDVLLVGHHGSRTSSGMAFLQAVGAQAAIVSAGYRNRYRHPQRQVWERLREAGMQRWRTDWQGAIRVRLHDRVAVSGWRGQRPRYWDPGWRDEPLR